MTSKTPNDVVERLEKLLQEGHKNGFSNEEVELLKKVAKFFIALNTLGKPGMVVLKILGYGAAMVIGFTAFKAGAGDILRGFLNG